ncbi:uncharacterized protein LOC111700406 [Eurytemora carolleeae]|uniref:uncharacterized protein LOC111700406 n=1 Tax=Eurytemora carolleeae TaxID=1294199 RepID=UPI000C793027|nr:uncharacterized protein LOC111700406 [Eurytemora carolleeae]|eukprot:XP_023327060.1 uncharacterized protein LOC111700406 [Eurytemora affinis]
MGLLLHLTVDQFIKARTAISITQRAKPLDDVFFPSLVVCNISPFRKSFVYFVHESLKKMGVKVPIQDIYSLGRLLMEEFVMGREHNITQERQELLDTIINSNFFEEYFRKFLNENDNPRIVNMTNGKLINYDQIRAARSIAGNYTKENKALYHKNFFANLASQWEIEQLVTYIQWNGFDSTQINNTKSTFQQLGFGTDYGVCVWLSTYYTNPQPGSEGELSMLPTGALNGENNGLSLLLDAETFDNSAMEDNLVGSRVGEGFKVAVIHPLDMPLMRQSGVNIDIGSAVQMAVSITQYTTTDVALSRFSPVDRRCWNTSEISFEILKYSDDYRYTMNNCLYEASLEKTAQDCGCIPGSQKFNKSPCMGKDLNCYQNVIFNTGLYRSIRDPNQNINKLCMSACFDQKYDLLVTSSLYPGKEINHKDDFCIIVNKLQRTCADFSRKYTVEKIYPNICAGVKQAMDTGACSSTIREPYNGTKYSSDPEESDQFKDTIVKYMRENIAVINVFIREPYILEISSDEQFSWTAFIGNLGGCLGLCIGASIISIIEVIWHLLMSLVSGLKSSQTKY